MPQAPHISFKGNTEGMNGNVFQCFEEQANCQHFTKTWKALGAYVSNKLKCAEDLAFLFYEEMVEPALNKPEALDENADVMDTAICKEEGHVQEQPHSGTGHHPWTMQQTHEGQAQVHHCF